MKSTDRFSGLAGIYAACRPSYPTEAIDFIITNCGLNRTSLLVDIGCGTGISTRLFSERGIRVVGIEPNADMRRAAEEAQTQSIDSSPEIGGTLEIGGVPASPQFIDATAEDTGLPDSYADAVLSAQAFHWFDPDRALSEFHRIVRPNGHVVLMWNERDESDEFTKGYGDLFRQLPETATVEMQRGIAGNPLLSSPLFRNSVRTNFSYSQRLDLDGLRGRAFSASYAPKDGAAAEQMRSGLKGLFEQFESNGFVDLQYETSVFIAQR